jgi:formylglycine-generating enzyme required for sulfatase activity
LHRQFIMARARLLMLVVLCALGCEESPAGNPRTETAPRFDGARAGDERDVLGIRLAWCPPGTFVMGSPPTEPERRPGEDQKEVTLTKGFWMAKYETTRLVPPRLAGWRRSRSARRGGYGHAE